MTDGGGPRYAVLLKNEEGPRWLWSITDGEESKPMRVKPKARTVKSDLANDLIDSSKPIS